MRSYSSSIILLSCFAFFSVVKADGPSVVEFQKKGNEIRLQVSQAYLTEVLNEISDKSGLLIHYSVLPETRVTATCVDQSIKSVLDCLFGGTIDMVFRYSENVGELPGKQPIEVWILGSSLSLDAGTIKQCVKLEVNTNHAQEKLKPNEDEQVKSSLEETLAFRMQMVVSDNAMHRSQAISYLAEHAALDDEAFNKILDDALTDSDAKVRGQAISALVRRQGEENSLSELQQALFDVDVSVRMMALQQVKKNVALIEQALNDEDDFVKQFAIMKLQSK